MQAWTEFYAVVGAAAAALLGLLFVSVSLNAASALGGGRSSSRQLAEQAFQNYVAVLMISLLALMPQISTTTYGLVVLSVTAAPAAWVLVRLYLTLFGPAAGQPRLLALRRHVTSLIGFGMLVAAAVRMAIGAGPDLNLFGASAIVLLISATVVSWELLTTLARVGQPRPDV